MKKSLFKGMLLVGVSSSLLACPGLAWAQDAEPATSQSVETTAPSASEVPDGDIVVTARRRSERLVDVPVSVSTLGGPAINRYATLQAATLSNQIPQLQLTSGGSTGYANIQIRGVGNLATDPGTQQMVSLNIDGVLISRGQSIISTGLLDLESVEVLKGPQALFFGKNSPGGVITLNSVSPGDTFEGYAKAGFNFLDKNRYLEGAVSIPLSNSFRVRIAGRAEESRGYMRNAAVPQEDAFHPGEIVHPGGKWGPGDRNYLGRLTAVYDPGGPFDATLKVYASRHEDNGTASSLEIIGCSPGATRPQVFSRINGAGSNVAVPDPTGDCVANDVRSSTGVGVGKASLFLYGKDDPYHWVNTYVASLVTNYQLDNFMLTSTTSYFGFHNRYFDNFNNASQHVNNGAQDNVGHTWSEELRASSSFDGSFNFTVGGIYSHENRPFGQSVGIFATPTENAFLPDGTRISNYFTIENYDRTASVFGEISFKLAPNLELTGGARYTREKVSHLTTQAYINPTFAATFLPAGTVLTGSEVYQDVSPEATLTWHPESDMTVYAAYKSGFLSGGYSNPGLLAAGYTSNALTFKPASAEGGEFGYKATVLDRKLSFDMTAYWYLYKDLQVTSYDPETIQYRTLNAASATVKGIDLQLNYRASSELTLRSFAAYNAARYRSFPDAQCFAGQTAAQGCVGGVQNLNGKRLGTGSDFTGSAGFTYQRPISGDWSIGLSSDVNYLSGFNPTGAGGSQYRESQAQPGYALLSASLRIFTPNIEWALIGNNLTDVRRVVFSQDAPQHTAGDIQGSRNRPREISIQATVKF